MKEYLNKGIKDIIARFPDVADILDEYHIGCAPCSVGSCLLKDVVEIHNLSEEDEQALMTRIARVIYPDRHMKVAPTKKKPKDRTDEIKYSPPLRRLVDEHALIKRWIGLIPKVVANLELESERGRQLILKGIDFIRSYADKYHHAKEEDILFQYFDEDLDILKAMREEHEKARGHAKAMLEALDKRDKETVVEHLKAYRELLTEHVKKEDEILYPWMDRNLSITQIGRLFSQFIDAEERMDKNILERCQRFVEELEEEMLTLKKEVTK